MTGYERLRRIRNQHQQKRVDAILRQFRAERAMALRRDREERVLAAWERSPLPSHRTEAGWPFCSTCDGGGCLDCTDPA